MSTNVQLGMWCWRLACSVGLFTLCMMAPGIKRRFAVPQSFGNRNVSLGCWLHFTACSLLISLVYTQYTLLLEGRKSVLLWHIFAGFSRSINSCIFWSVGD